MELTETRKAIIELIEPYMNKEKWVWAFYKWKDWTIEVETNYWYEYYAWKIHWWFSHHLKPRWEIIWHYDITAVLKYINRQGRLFIPKLLPMWNMFWVFYVNRWEKQCKFNQIDSIWDFPNKPLHLYDTNEEENLLKLLQSLNK